MAWPNEPVDYDSPDDFEGKDAGTDHKSIEKFKKGQYVVLMCASNERAYAMFQLRQVVDAKVVALMQELGRFKKYPPGMYALVEFIHLLETALQHRKLALDVNIRCHACYD